MLSTKMLFFKLALSYKMYYLAIFIPSSVCHYSTTAQHRYHQWWHGRGGKYEEEKEEGEVRVSEDSFDCCVSEPHISLKEKREKHRRHRKKKRMWGRRDEGKKEEEIFLTISGKISIFLCCILAKLKGIFYVFVFSYVWSESNQELTARGSFHK